MNNGGGMNNALTSNPLLWDSLSDGAQMMAMLNGQNRNPSMSKETSHLTY